MGSESSELLQLEVDVVTATVVKPDYTDSTPPPTTEIPLTVFDQLVTDSHIAVLFAFAAPTPSNSTILRALSTTLAHFPTLAGRFSRSGCSILVGPSCSTAGVLVLEAEAKDHHLSAMLPLTPSPDSLLLHPPTQGAVHLCQAQLTRFQCGGIVLGFTAHHHVADGQSMSLFYTALGRAVRGLPVESLPSYDQSWLQPRTSPRCEFDHWGVEFSHSPTCRSSSGKGKGHGNGEPPWPSNIRTIQLHFSGEFIQTLKHQLPPDQKHSTFEVLLAHLWRKITIARCLHPDTCTRVNVAVNGRRRLRRDVPPNYFGNLVLYARPCAKVANLTAKGGIVFAVQLIGEAIADTSDSYFQSVIDFTALNKDENVVPAYDDDWVMCPDLEVDSWLGFKFERLDFGGGGLCGFSTTWISGEGVILIAPEVVIGDCNGGRGAAGMDVCVTVSLFEWHAKELIRIAYFTD